MRHRTVTPIICRRHVLSHLGAVIALVSAGEALAQGSLLDQGRNLLGGGSGGSGSAAGLTNQQADSGLREALRIASQRTVARVGRADGYLRDPAIKIPLPSYLAGARDMLAKAGMSGMLDDLELRMNRAAEAAAPKAVDIFSKAISSMSVSDARGIISGPQDAATQYFKRTTTEPLTRAFRPIMDQSLSQAGASQAFQKLSQNMPSGGDSSGGVGRTCRHGGPRRRCRRRTPRLQLYGLRRGKGLGRPISLHWSGGGGDPQQSRSPFDRAIEAGLWPLSQVTVVAR